MKIIRCQRGAAAVEFAIIAPLLFTIIFGIIEFSLLFYDKAVITNASREGARFGIVFDDSQTYPQCRNSGRSGDIYFEQACNIW